MASPGMVNTGISYWEVQLALAVADTLQYMKKQMNITSLLSITKKIKHGYSVSSFGFIEGSPYINEFTSRSKYMLDDYISYFEREAKDIIPDAEDDFVDLCPIMGENFWRPVLIKSGIDPKLQRSFYNNIQVDHVYGIQSYFTCRERECISEILLGKTAQQIGDQLHLSRRSVENYIAIIKEKLNCCKKSEILQKVNQLKEMGLF